MVKARREKWGFKLCLNLLKLEIRILKNHKFLNKHSLNGINQSYEYKSKFSIPKETVKMENKKVQNIISVVPERIKCHQTCPRPHKTHGKVKRIHVFESSEFRKKY